MQVRRKKAREKDSKQKKKKRSDINNVEETENWKAI